MAKVSVITVSFNSIDTIERTIRSVQAQEGVEVEHIFIDGGSTDGTVNLIKSYSRSDDRWLSENDAGIYDAMNKGISLASGEIIAILNSDDEFAHPRVLKNVVDILSGSTYEMVYSNIYYTDNDRNICGKWKVSPFVGSSFSAGWHPPHPGFFCKKSCYVRGGVFDIAFEVAADFDLMLRFFEIYKFDSFYLDDFTVLMYQGGNSAKLKGILKGFLDIKRSFVKNKIQIGISYFFSRYFNKFFRKFLAGTF